MKKFFSFLFIISISFSLSAQTNNEKNKQKASSMMPIIDGLYETISTLEKENVEVVRIEFDIISTQKSLLRTFSAKYTYGVMVYGDYRIKKIDIQIFEQNDNGWKLVQNGENNGSSSIVHIEPEKTQNYKIEIKVSQFAEGYSTGHYGLIIIHN